MDTPLARALGLELPIFAFTHCRDVAAAVSKAGGMGILGVAAHSKEGLRAELEWIEKDPTTGKTRNPCAKVRELPHTSTID